MEAISKAEGCLRVPRTPASARALLCWPWPFLLRIAWSTPLFWATLNCDLSRLACASLLLRLRAPYGRPLGCTSTGSKIISVSGCSRRGISVSNQSKCQCLSMLWRGMWTCRWRILSKSWAYGNPCAERKVPLHCDNGCDSFLNCLWILLSALGWTFPTRAKKIGVSYLWVYGSEQEPTLYHNPYT